MVVLCGSDIDYISLCSALCISTRSVNANKKPNNISYTF